MTVQLIRRTAKEIAGAWYEGNRTRQFRTSWPDQKAYIKLNWPHFVTAARESMAKMLGDPMTSEHLKAAIFEAMIEDRQRQSQIKTPKRWSQVDAGASAE